MRDEILNGNLPLPGYDKFVANGYEPIIDIIDSMWSSLWHNYCAKTKGTSSIYWMEQAGKENTRLYLAALNVLQHNGWVSMDTRDNYSEVKLNELKLLEFVTADELADVTFAKRFNKYLPLANISKQDGLARVRANGVKTTRRLARPGMETGAKSEFTFDRAALSANLVGVTAEANKGMAKVLAKYPELQNSANSYDKVTESIVGYLAEEEVVMNMGVNDVDSRGRAIKTHLAKVMNPIGFKVARSLLVIPQEHRKAATKHGMNAILLFIAEVNGYKKGSIENKRLFGEQCWVEGRLPKDLYKAIWCKRLYKELYQYQIALLEGKQHHWSTPIELDASASCMQYIGVLLNDKNLMGATNLLSEGQLADPWGLIKDVTRDQTKSCIMKQVYGSTLASAALLDQDKIEYTTQDILHLEKGLHEGAYGVANAFKKFVISSAMVDEVIYPVVNGENLEVPCNRHHVHGDKPVIYSMLDSKGRVKKVVHWKTVTTPDLKSFKRWTVTGLIHSLDSQVIDAVMAALTWGIDIHDAVICNPEDDALVRLTYAKSMDQIHRDRDSILNEYFASVGIKKTAKAVKLWNELKALVEPLDEPFNCSIYAMK